MLVVAVVMILVVGPKDLPGMLRTIGKTVGNLKRMASDFQRQFSDALRESELDEMKNDLTSDIKEATAIGNPLDDINSSADELMDALNADVDDEIAADVLSSNAKPGATKPSSAIVAKPTKRKTPAKAPAKKRAVKTTPKKPAKAQAPKRKTTAKRKPATGSDTS